MMMNTDLAHDVAVPLAESEIRIPLDPFVIEGVLTLPEGARSLVVFAHGSAASRLSPRNRVVANALHRARMGTLLLDLATDDEELVDEDGQRPRFDVEFLAGRLVITLDWLRADARTAHLPLGLYGASTGAATALIAASERSNLVGAVVSRGGRTDLVGAALASLRAPTLFIVGSDDLPVLAMNELACDRLRDIERRLEVVPGAHHLFNEPGSLARVIELTRAWFADHLGD